jgi:hypothetical protein
VVSFENLTKARRYIKRKDVETQKSLVPKKVDLNSIPY